MNLPLSPELICTRFDAPGVLAIVLMGSYARDEAGPYSDIDIVRFVAQPATLNKTQELDATGSHLIDGYLVVVSSVELIQVEAWFSEPEKASETIVGIRRARALLDRDGTFETIQKRAKAFVWDGEMQSRANAWASRQMVGWIEEVHKGLEGLRLMSSGSDPAENHEAVGRLLQARFGLSWGLSRVMQVQRGVLIAGDNAFYDQVAQAVGPDSQWVALRRQAFGIGQDVAKRSSLALTDQVKAGLRLYVVTAELLGDALSAQDRPLIQETVDLISDVVGPPSPGTNST